MWRGAACASVIVSQQGEAGMRKRRTLLIRVAVAAVVLFAGCGLLAAFNPRSADHFGYALPGENGLPHRVSYAGRDYRYTGACWSEAQLKESELWPLRQVGTVPTLFGAPHPILSSKVPAGMTTMRVVVPLGTCYAFYGLEGSP
jgi:hypothetical protein